MVVLTMRTSCGADQCLTGITVNILIDRFDLDIYLFTVIKNSVQTILIIVETKTPMVLSYDQLVTSGQTNSGGMVSCTASYFYYNRNSADSTGFNDFTVKVILNQDSTIDSAFTVGWTAAGGTDTLDLANTVGTGEWGGEASPSMTRHKLRKIYLRGKMKL